MSKTVFPFKESVVFTTREFSQVLGISLSAASSQLGRLCKKKRILKISRGFWANMEHPHFTPLSAVPFLLGNEQGYVSFLTALHYHGMISQIPATIQVATTSPRRMLRSEIGRFEFFKLNPSMMNEGVVWSETNFPYRLASVEKALLDTLYISTRKGRRFASLPEIEWVSTFSNKRFLSLLGVQVPNDRIKNAILRRFNILHQSND